MQQLFINHVKRNSTAQTHSDNMMSEQFIVILLSLINEHMTEGLENP